MSKMLGGLFSRPSGKASGLVFGAGRTRRGKQVTAREYTIPTDPKTNSQLVQRGKMPYSTAIVRSIGRSIYQFDWNRAISTLPGFQSLSSLFMRFVDGESGELSLPSEVSLGVRHFPETVTVATEAGNTTVTFSTETGEIGSATDTAVVIAIPKAPEAESVQREVVVDTSQTRDDGEVVLTGITGAEGDYKICLYFRSDEAGLRSNERRSVVRWFDNAVV